MVGGVTLAANLTVANPEPPKQPGRPPSPVPLKLGHVPSTGAGERAPTFVVMIPSGKSPLMPLMLARFHIHVGARQDIVPLEQRATAIRILHPPADQISFEDGVEGSLFGLGRYPVDRRSGIGRIAVGRKSRIHMSNERRPSIP